MNLAEITPEVFPELARFWSVQLRSANVNLAPEVLESYLLWLARNPFRKSAVPLGWVARPEGAVAGMLLCQVCRFERCGQPIDAVLCTQYYVAPEHRSLGMPIFLKFRALNKDFPLYVCGANQTTAGLFRAIGATPVFPSTGYEILRVLDWRPVVEDRVSRRLPRALARVIGAAALLANPHAQRSGDHSLEAITPEEAAALHFAEPSDPVVLERTAGYLRWRLESPFFRGGGYYRYRAPENSTDCVIGLAMRPRGLNNNILAASLLDHWGRLDARTCGDLVHAIEAQVRARAHVIVAKFLRKEEEASFLVHGFRKRHFPAPTAFVMDKDGQLTGHEWRLTASATDLL